MNETTKFRTPIWDQPRTVASFTSSPPNHVLLAWVKQYSRGLSMSILDIGCGAGRNSLPLARAGHVVTGVDLSKPMIQAARQQAEQEGLTDRCLFSEGIMDNLPTPSARFDIVVAHGIWNLATSDLQLVTAMKEAGRVARPGAGLFVFTFSKKTLTADTTPLSGQRLVYDHFSGKPQVFVTEEELDRLLARAGFDREVPGPLTEYNSRAPVSLKTTVQRPVIWEGTWIRGHRFDLNLKVDKNR